MVVVVNNIVVGCVVNWLVMPESEADDMMLLNRELAVDGRGIGGGM